jgi:hypothetical protein
VTQYGNSEHATAIRHVFAGQVARRETGIPFETSLRALESMAPENTGRPRHRAITIASRSMLALRTSRDTARQSARNNARGKHG